MHGGVAFAGTPAFAATVLRALLAAGYPPRIVYTQPDRPAGRGRRLRPSAVRETALEHGLHVVTPRSLKDAEAIQPLAAAACDVLIVAAYGLLLPRRVLSLPTHGCVNVHASLLPRWRGAAPVERAIMAGDAVTGITLMQMDAGLDTGPILDHASIPIEPSETGGALEARLAALGASLLVRELPRILAGEMPPTPQDATRATLAPKLTATDACVNWSRTAIEIANQVRALADRLPVTSRLGEETVQLLAASPIADTCAEPPGSIADRSDGAIVVACGSGALRIDQLRITSRGKGKPMTAGTARNGFHYLFKAGARLDAS